MHSLFALIPRFFRPRFVVSIRLRRIDTYRLNIPRIQSTYRLAVLLAVIQMQKNFSLPCDLEKLNQSKRVANFQFQNLYFGIL